MKFAVSRDHRLYVIEGDEAVEVTDLVGTLSSAGPLADLIAEGVEVREEDLAGRRRVPVGDLNLGAPLPRPGKIIGAPANYYDHVNEMPDSATVVEWGVFLKANSSVIGPGDAIVLPYSDKRTDHEGELAVIIGRGGRHIRHDEALEHVFGYTCLLDITVRSTEDRSTRKSFDGFTPLGPFVLTADEIFDPADLELTCWVNGTQRQHTSLSKLIYSVPELIAYASSVMTLHPGDVIATGTPAGVGPLAHGDEVVVEITRLGRLAVHVDGSQAISHDARPGFAPKSKSLTS